MGRCMKPHVRPEAGWCSRNFGVRICASCLYRWVCSCPYQKNHFYLVSLGLPDLMGRGLMSPGLAGQL